MRTQRRTDTWLMLLALALLLISPIENALSGTLSQLLPAFIRDHALVIFAILLVALIMLDLALIPIRRTLAGDSIRARSRRLKRWNYTLTVGLGLIGAAAGVIGPLAIGQVPAFTQLARTYPWMTLALPLVLLVILIALPLLADLLSARPNQEAQDEQAFLRLLASRYRRYLDDPLQRAVRAQLDLRETPSALQHPEMTIATPDAMGASDSDSPAATAQAIAPDQTLLAIFEAAQRQLLILGAPGAGKSTQLNILGRDLAWQAEHDLSARLPVVLDLSTWASNQDPLEKWLADEIAESYAVNKHVAARWVQNQRILPLLDGLDVMSVDDRSRCVDAINTYLAAHPSEPLVVCSRREEYDRIAGARLALQQAVMLQPLTNISIDHALAEGGSRVATLRQVVAEDDALRDAVRTPLLLSLVMLTYGDDLRAEDIPLPKVGATDAWRHELFRRYVERMLTHSPGAEQQPLDYTEDQIQMTLSWLGYELRAHHETAFYLERLQADWLPTFAAERHYRRWLLSIGIGLALVVGLVGGLIGGLIGSQARELFGELVPWLSFGLGFVLFGGAVGVLGGDLFSSSEPIVPVVRLQVTWQGLRIGLGSGLLFGLTFGLFVGIFVGLGFGLAIGLVVGLGEGLATVHVRDEDLRQPNEGIRNSAQSALLSLLGFGPVVGLVAGLGSGLVVGKVGGVERGWEYGLEYGTLLSLLIGLGIGLDRGIIATLKHLALRRALRRSGVVPPRLVRFLDEATARVLLRRVGGGYQFIHQLLRDDFADQYTPPKAR